MTDAPILNIIGEKVALGPHRRDLLPAYLRWINNFEVRGMMGSNLRPMTLEAETDWYEKASREAKDVHFTVYDNATLTPIGTAALHHVHQYHRTAEFGIMIGDPANWNKGYGTETTCLMLRHGFVGLGLHAIRLRVYGNNPRALRAYEKAGFQIAGRLREALRVDGEVCDEIYMDCLATEWLTGDNAND